MSITEKSSIYSYGVVVLEILSGCRDVNTQIGDGLHFREWVKKKMESFKTSCYSSCL